MHSLLLGKHSGVKSLCQVQACLLLVETNLQNGYATFNSTCSRWAVPRLHIFVDTWSCWSFEFHHLGHREVAGFWQAFLGEQHSATGRFPSCVHIASYAACLVKHIFLVSAFPLLFSSLLHFFSFHGKTESWYRSQADLKHSVPVWRWEEESWYYDTNILQN